MAVMVRTRWTEGYRPILRVLHWLTVAVVVAQLVVGYLLDVDDGGRGRGRGRGRGGEGGGEGRGRGRGGGDGVDGGLSALDEPLVWVHLALGLTILILAVTRLVVRHRVGLPPWSPRLGPRARRLQGWTERALLGLLVVTPLTGVPLLLGGDDLLSLHVAAHVCLYAALATHVGTVLACRTWPRMVTGRPV